MGILKVTELQPGMVLAKDLTDVRGRFLLGRGVRLTPKHLKVLKIWGVIEADIERVTEVEVEANLLAQIDPVLIEAVRSSLLGRFLHTDVDHPVIRELLQLCTLRKIARISNGDASVGSSSHSGPGSPEPGLSPKKAFEEAPGHPAANNPAHRSALSTLPTIIAQFNELIHSPNSSAKDLAEVIEKDTSLSARLLRIVNSAFYGFPSRIDTLHRTIAIVGIRQLGNLVMGIKILTVFKKIPSDLIDMQSFLEHSTATGVLAKILADYTGTQNAERFFLGGLLHDLGRLILYNLTPAEARKNLLLARERNELVYRMEEERMHCDHARMGGDLLREWKVPVSLENMVRYHHQPLKAKVPFEPAIVHFADVVINALQVGTSGERMVPHLDSGAWECMGLSKNHLDLAVKQFDLQFQALSGLLQSNHR